MRAASDDEAARDLLGLLREAVIVAVVTRGFVEGDADPLRRISLSSRVQALLVAHADSVGGQPCPTGSDVGMACFVDAPAALAAVWSLIDEIEAARPADSHRHHRMLGVGVASGPVLACPDGRMLGVATGRALRLALAAERGGDVLIDDPVAQGSMAEGFGLHRGRQSVAQRLGFGFHHLVDGRAPER